MSTWRDIAAPIILETVREVTGRARRPFTDDEKRAIRKALRDRYPFGERAMWPYKVWLDEIRRQLEGGKTRVEDERQGRLF